MRRGSTTRPPSLRLLVAACGAWSAMAPALAARESPGETEGDDIAANLNRTDELESAQGLGFLEDFARWRGDWRKRAGFDCGVTYHTFVTGALGGDGIPTAAAGDLTLQGIWAPGHAWRDDPLELRFRIRQRNGFGDPAPSALGEEIGTLWGVVDGFSDRGFEVPDFYLLQRLSRVGLEVRYGQMSID